MIARDFFPDPGDLAAGLRLVRDLPSVLRHPLDPVVARAALGRRLAEREADFVAHIGRVVYDEPRSPYRALLRWAGCEQGDLARLVALDGLEGALETLRTRGVYLTAEEFRGRHDVVRGGLRLKIQPADLRTPAASFHLGGQSGGSRSGKRLPVRIDLAWLRDRGVDAVLALAARGGLAWRHAVWSVPGSAVLSIVLRYSLCGAPPVRWFSQIDPDAPALPSRYRWSGRALRWGSLLAGVPLPGPQYAPVDAPEPILRWIEDVRRAGQTPHVDTFPSSAVRLCLAARAAGRDLSGTQFTLAGEPVTPARVEVIERAGAEVATYYAAAGVGILGFWCLRPATVDDVHLAHDLCAVIQPGGSDMPTGSSRPLLVTSLRPAAPFVLLNVGLGDEAVLSRHVCGCPLEGLGWTTHVQDIRSYEKLTAAGVTLPDADVVRALEEVLPARFGGSPTDYQLLEEEGEHGQPRLRLLIHPRVGQVDRRAVAEALLGALADGVGPGRVMELTLRGAGVLEAERRAPILTASGKILHLHAGGAERRVGAGAATAERA